MAKTTLEESEKLDWIKKTFSIFQGTLPWQPNKFCKNVINAD